MKKLIRITGMSCEHCSARVTKALNALPEASASVDLSAGTALVESGTEITDDALTQAVEELGFEVTGVESL